MAGPEDIALTPRIHEGKNSGHWDEGKPVHQDSMKRKQDRWDSGALEAYADTSSSGQNPEPRTNLTKDFCAIYPRKSGEFDLAYHRIHDDLDSIFVSAILLSFVSATFITRILPKLEPGPNEMTAAYTQTLTHAVNNSPLTDVNSTTVTWAGPPQAQGIITAFSLLYASPLTSLLAALLAMLGKQWVDRYTWTGGGSIVERGRSREWKLDGFQKWRFHVFVQTLQVIPQFALLLLVSGVSKYLWTINKAIALIVVGSAAFPVVLFVIFTLSA